MVSAIKCLSNSNIEGIHSECGSSFYVRLGAGIKLPDVDGLRFIWVAVDVNLN
jgi:hypothetical protein